MRAHWLTGVALILLTGCSSMNSMTMPSFTKAAPKADMPRETFSYKPAVNGNLRVEVETITLAADPGFIPTDPNWLQMQVKVTNIGKQTINLTRISERLADGHVLASASSGGELIKPPSMVKEMAVTTGVGVGGMMVGAMLFPPAMLLSGAYMAFRPMFVGDKVAKVAERLNQEGLHVGPIAPGTSMSGLIFVPAVTGQTGLITFYEVGGATQSLSISRVQ